MIGMRLKEQREMAGLTQPQLAAAVGAAKRTIIDWEKGATSPTGTQLAAMVQLGIDVLYILTGQRSAGAASAPQLTHREAALLDNYRHSPEEGRAALDQTSAALAQSLALTTQPRALRRKDQSG